MQHTETYNLNLIETSDTFSPDPLNQNAQALEDAVEAVRAEAQAADSALDARIQTLEGKHIKCGMYTMNSNAVPMTIHLGFTPKAVLAIGSNGAFCGMLFSGYSSSSNPPAKIVPGGFELTRVTQGAYGVTLNTTYMYIALD